MKLLMKRTKICLYKLIEMILHAVLEADDGPELDISIGGVLDTRLVVNPINDAFGIPEEYLTVINEISKYKLIKDSNNRCKRLNIISIKMLNIIKR